MSITHSLRRFWRFAAAATLLSLPALCPSSAQAAIISLGAWQDNTLIANNVNNSLGGGPAFFAGTNANNSPRRALLDFDLSGIPAGAIITDVQLILTLAQVSGGSPGSATIGLFDLTQSWGEGTAGSSATGVAGTGNGFAAGTGDATWTAARFGSATWSTAGGDHLSTASASLTLVGTSVGTAYTWLSTAQLVADVQGWLDQPATNFGWEMINANEATANSLYGFYSSEWHTFSGGLTSQEPVLQVTYTVPEPIAGAFAAVAGMFCLVKRPRHARRP